MKKLGLLFACAAILTSCIFESDSTGVNSWLSSHSMPDNYKLQVLNVENLKPLSVTKAWNGTPRLILDSLPVALGRSNNVAQDMFLDIAFAVGSKFADSLKVEETTVTSTLSMPWYEFLYKTKHFPKDSLPIEDSLKLSFSWKLDFGNKAKFLDSITRISDSKWLESLKEWEADGSADTAVALSYTGESDKQWTLIPVPEALVKALREVKYAVHLQLRVSAPEAKHMFRFYSDSSSRFPARPRFNLYADTVALSSPTPFRVANIAVDKEECSDCPILHGAVRDSLVVRLPAEPILKAMDEFYDGDTLAVKGDGYDVRQAVILARLTMSRDDSQGGNEFGLPIQVVVSSYADSADTVMRLGESYRLNHDEILAEGHQNLVFHPGNSLSLQLSNGVGKLLNKGDKDGYFDFVVKMGFPLLDVNDTAYSSVIVTESDSTNKTFFTELDYARYDFSTSMENPMSLKLWLASKRGGK